MSNMLGHADHRMVVFTASFVSVVLICSGMVVN